MTTTDPTLCARCGENPRLGQLSRCLHCLRSDADRAREHRHRAERAERIDQRRWGRALQQDARDWQAPPKPEDAA